MLSNLASISKSLLAAFRRAWAFLKFNGFLKGFWVGIFVYFYRFIGFPLWLAGICFFLESDVCNVHICQVTKFSLSWWTIRCPLWYWPPDPYRCYSLSMCHNSKPVITSSCHCRAPGTYGKVNATTECFHLKLSPLWYKIWSINRVLLKNCSPDSSRKHLIPCNSPQTGQLPATPSAEAQPRGQMSWSQRIGGALAMSFCQIHFFFWLEDDRHLLRPAAASCRQVESTLP